MLACAEIMPLQQNKAISVKNSNDQRQQRAKS
jgi:hypothetical protein